MRSLGHLPRMLRDMVVLKPLLDDVLESIYLDNKFQENNRRPYMRWVNLSGEQMNDMNLKSAISTQLC